MAIFTGIVSKLIGSAGTLTFRKLAARALNSFLRPNNAIPEQSETVSGASLGEAVKRVGVKCV